MLENQKFIPDSQSATPQLSLSMQRVSVGDLQLFPEGRTARLAAFMLPADGADLDAVWRELPALAKVGYSVHGIIFGNLPAAKAAVLRADFDAAFGEGSFTAHVRSDRIGKQRPDRAAIYVRSAFAWMGGSIGKPSRIGEAVSHAYSTIELGLCAFGNCYRRAAAIH
ncbi:hypothetical protein D0Z70_19995 [Sphingobium terrigena]|uniref:Uncharacterized protein n=1 Tax=Sphingobium terrigena TaxID=2304063 RepID=A0A418YMV5_9SPHN|nr:hypothetical protein [Sphingobium terrigena]RJG52492.1 hypothetical protein D0Z70_19995 [Sphingobium terrigena]